MAGDQPSVRKGYLPIMAEMFRFYFRFSTSVRRLHPGIASGKMLPPGPEHVGQLTMDASLIKDFNQEYERLAEMLRKSTCFTLEYSTMLYGSQILRVLTCIAAFLAPQWALPIGALQFVLAPFSFPIAVMFLFVNCPEYTVHYIFAAILGPICGGLGPVVTVGYGFIISFLILDQLANLFFYLRDNERIGLIRLLRHVVVGTINTKSYNLIVLGFLWGFKIDLVLVVLTSALTFPFNKYVLHEVLGILGLPGHDVRYYMQHRVAHLPLVYTHAHKMHHHFHDTVPWDAQFYGSGINEVFFVMVLDFLPCLLAPSRCIMPSCFNLQFIHLSLIGKAEHCRSKRGTQAYDSENFHADHHTYHVKNFAVPDGALIDFYFGTQAPQCKGTLGLSFTRQLNSPGEDSVGERITIDISAVQSVKKD